MLLTAGSSEFTVKSARPPDSFRRPFMGCDYPKSITSRRVKRLPQRYLHCEAGAAFELINYSIATEKVEIPQATYFPLHHIRKA